MVPASEDGNGSPVAILEEIRALTLQSEWQNCPGNDPDLVLTRLKKIRRMYDIHPPQGSSGARRAGRFLMHHL
jgi:hypothetical protein